MSERQDRFRKLLWAYPKSYRDARGEEIIATLLDATPPEKRGPTFGDGLNVALHGTRERIACARSATLVVLAIAVAMGGAVVFDLARPPTFQSASKVTIGPLRQSLVPTPMATELRELTAAPVRSRAAKLLGHPLPTCMASQVSTSNVIAVSCVASKPQFAAAAANAMVAAYETVLRAKTTRVATRALVVVQAEQQATKLALAGTTRALRSLSRSSPSYGVYVREQRVHVQAMSQLTLATERLHLELIAPPASVTILERASPSTSPLAPLSVPDLAAAALCGLAAGFVLLLVRRRDVRIHPTW